MKKLLIILMVVFAAGPLVTGCSEDDKPDKNNSIFVDDDESLKNDFDRWIDENFRDAYNMMFYYKYNDIESDLTYNLVPATYRQSIALAKLCKFLWIEPYIEIKDVDFIRQYIPKVVQVIGSVGYDGSTIRLGTAEGGMKVTLYAGNWLDIENPDIDDLNDWYFNTMHHEFAHILHQTIDYPREFNLISVGDYSPAAWFNRKDVDVFKLGFVSPYASSESREDFVETMARYLTRSDASWNSMLQLAGDTGAPKILQKLQIVRTYLRDSWGIDLEELRTVLFRRYDELPLLDLETL